MARYVALVDGKPGAFGVVVPDLPGSTSGGVTVDAALRNAVEAATLWVEDARADGEKIPKARSAETLRDDPEVAIALAHGGILAYVPLVLDAGRPVKANLSLDVGRRSRRTSRVDPFGFPRQCGAGEDRERRLA